MLEAKEMALLRQLVWEIERHFMQNNLTQRGKLTMTVVITDDQSVRLRPSGVDRDGVVVPAASLAGIEMTIDNPAVASLAADPANPGCFILTPLAAAPGTASPRMAQVTATDPVTSLSTITPVEIDAGAEVGLSVAGEILTGGAAATTTT